MIKQFLTKRKKLLKGLYRSFQNLPSQNSDWWDSYYSNGISDSATLAPTKSNLSSQYHYRSVEQIILMHLYNNNIDAKWVLDVGSGSGHWIKFYLSLDMYTFGFDTSKKVVEYLRNKYPSIGLSVSNKIRKTHDTVDIVNAIGVMFHITDDKKWEEMINDAYSALSEGGIFIIGGHFGLLNGLNVQISNGQVNKRLRSLRVWKMVLRKAGFTKIKLYRNNSYLYINDTMPENNILIATK